MRVELPEDQWAEIMEPGDLRRADKKAVLRSTEMEIDPGKGKAYVNGAADEDALDAMLTRVITGWSFMFPIPRDDKASLGKLTLEQGDVLGEAVKPHMQLIFKNEDANKKGTDPTAG